MRYSKRRLLIGFAIILVTISALYVTINADLSGVIKFFLGVSGLVLSGVALQKVMGLEGDYGVILLRHKKGLEFIDKLAKRYRGQWKWLADFGLILGFGLAGFLVVKKKRKRPLRTASLFLSSFAALFFISLFISPNIVPMISSIVTSIDIGAASSQLQDVTRGSPLFLIGTAVVLFGGGVAGVGVASIIGYGAVVGFTTISSLVGGQPPQAAPGATLILPGVTIPLVEGIIALVVILIVHETAHGILARVAKIKLKSAGLVFLGVIPAGAFIDPDEDALKKGSKEDQNRVLVAGSTANMITAVIAFFLLIGFLFATAGCRDDVVRIEGGSGIIPAGTIITHIDGMKIGEMENRTFAPNKTVILTAEDGNTFTVQSNEEGKIGSQIVPYTIISRDGAALFVGDGKVSVSTWRFYFPPSFWWMAFVYTTLALITTLNFVIGVVNLLPVPVFDGHRLLDVNVKNKLVVNAITTVVVASFLLNFLPWLFM